MTYSKSNINVLPYSSTITENININSGNLNLMNNIVNSNHSAGSIPNKNMINHDNFTEKLKNISFKMNDKMINEKIFIKTNSISAKINEYSNRKNDSLLHSLGNLAKGLTDPNFPENHIIRNKNISSIKPDKSSYMNKMNVNSENVNIDLNKSPIPNTLRISKENLIYLNKISKNLGGNKL